MPPTPKTVFFVSNPEFQKEFQRCCKNYQILDMYVAWVGNPQAVIPFEYLHNLSKISAVVGVSFCQTHPEGIKFLMDLGTDLRIANIRNGHKEVLYHPKIYIFSNQRKKAIFIGSSNFTMNGFNENLETNVLIEGAASDRVIDDFEIDLKKWRTKKFSFTPDEDWLLNYTEHYKKRRQKLKAAGLDDEAEKEEQTTNSAAWLAIADWDVYRKKVMKSLKSQSTHYQESLTNKIELFNLYKDELRIPWKTDYFKDIKKRRFIGGMYPYGWLGHVAASGDFRRMLANGSPVEKKTIITSINSIGKLSFPLGWKQLRYNLNKLVALGPTMKVWGRLLAIIRPDLFCTISAPQVRRNIANTLDQSDNIFEEVEGYLMLLRLIHSSPWFKSNPPKAKNELEIWKRRVAFLDVVFYK